MCRLGVVESLEKSKWDDASGQSVLVSGKFQVQSAREYELRGSITLTQRNATNLWTRRTHCIRATTMEREWRLDLDEILHECLALKIWTGHGIRMWIGGRMRFSGVQVPESGPDHQGSDGECCWIPEDLRDEFEVWIATYG